MQIIVPGHKYSLAPMLGISEPQEIQFIQKEEGKPDIDGTTNEEILSAMIDRMQFLQGKFPCRENAITITKLEEALMWLNKRTADRVARNVEGKHVV